MKQKLIPKEFEKLSFKDQCFYVPFYAKYKKVRKRSECETCGHFEGYYYREKGIGKPIGYKYSFVQGIWLPRMLDTFMASSVMDKITKLKNG